MVDKFLKKSINPFNGSKCTTQVKNYKSEFCAHCVFNSVEERFGPTRDEVTGECRKLHNEELSVRHSLPNIVRVVKSSRMRWAGHVARMGEGRGVYRVLVAKT